jgi:peroxiredoxin
VLDDVDFSIGRRLGVRSVPHVSIIDAEGRLRLTNGASLIQVVGYKTDLAQAVRKVAEAGKLMTYGILDPYYPVKELEGQRCPEFSAPLLSTSVEQKSLDLLDTKKLNVLIFWSVGCPHCRKSLPEINAWLQQHPDGVNVISAASVDTDEAKIQTREFCESNHLSFPTLVDQDARLGQLFQVTTTPTIVIIRPDGVIDSTIVSGQKDFGHAIEETKRRLLGPSGSPG